MKVFAVQRTQPNTYAYNYNQNNSLNGSLPRQNYALNANFSSKADGAETTGKKIIKVLGDFFGDSAPDNRSAKEIERQTRLDQITADSNH